MKQWIRWKGLAAFAVLVILIAGFWYLAAGRIVARAIEIYGTRAVGAKVEVASARVGLFPISLGVTGIDVTDPDRPMTNAVSVGRINGALEIGPLLRRKIVISEMAVQGLRFNTARRRSGALAASAGKDEKAKQPSGAAPPSAGVSPPWVDRLCGAGSLPSLDLPDAKQILAKEQLASLKLADDFKADVDNLKAEWQQRLKDLPDQKDFEAYQQRIGALKSSGGLNALLGGASEISAITGDLKKDIERVKQARRQLTADTADIKRRAAALSQAPAADLARLKEKYSLSAKGMTDISRLLFGQRLCGWGQTAYQWYGRIQPWLGRVELPEGQAPPPPEPERGKGVTIRFAETRPLPDFLIRNAKLEVILNAGQLTGQAANITNAPEVLGAPLTFKFLGRRLKGLEAASVIGVIDYVKPDRPRHTLNMLVKRVDIRSLDLNPAPNLPFSIDNALADVDLDFKMVGPQLDALLDARLEAVKMAVGKTTESAVSKALADALAGVDKFGLKVALTGAGDALKADVHSDLDGLLNQAVGKMLRNAGNRLTADLKKGIAAKVNGPIQAARGQSGALGSIDSELAKRLNLGNGLLGNVKLPF